MAIYEPVQICPKVSYAGIVPVPSEITSRVPLNTTIVGSRRSDPGIPKSVTVVHLSWSAAAITLMVP